MSFCFVMQPFDGGMFDRRFGDVFAPAIKAAGLEPYRVDQDPAVSIPIQDIEKGIRDARLCLAEITLDNPNVWFELGYAIAAGKEVVLVCSDERTTRFPFDIQHRSIITYSTKSKGDYTNLETQITERILAYLKRLETIASASTVSRLEKMDGLEQHEIVALAAIAENFDHPEDHASAWQVKRDMEASGFTKLAATMAIRSLTEKELVTTNSYSDPHDHERYIGVGLTDNGWRWIMANKDRFALQRKQEVDEEIPF